MKAAYPYVAFNANGIRFQTTVHAARTPEHAAVDLLFPSAADEIAEFVFHLGLSVASPGWAIWWHVVELGPFVASARGGIPGNCA